MKGLFVLIFSLSLQILRPPLCLASAKSFFIDVRTPKEFAISHVEGAVNLDVKDPDFSMKIQTLNKQKDYEIYCHSGRRAAKAIEIMKKAGFTNLHNAGGLKDAEKIKNQKN